MEYTYYSKDIQPPLTLRVIIEPHSNFAKIEEGYYSYSFPTNETAFNSFMYYIEYFTGNLVTGDLLDETGTNCEPLIKNVKILKKL